MAVMPAPPMARRRFKPQEYFQYFGELNLGLTQSVRPCHVMAYGYLGLRLRNGDAVKKGVLKLPPRMGIYTSMNYPREGTTEKKIMQLLDKCKMLHLCNITLL